MKNLLIISPHFPPVNAADMHRVRQSVWYFEAFGWKPTIVSVHEKCVEAEKESLLEESLPESLSIVKVRAFSTSWTRKIGLGALALRSLLFYLLAVNKLIKNNTIDLIYFSTTQFPVLILGRYWKWRFKVPYIIDMQDPWHSTYYLDKPKNERPKKYWFSYYLNKSLEPLAMKGCDGLISVSAVYIEKLKERYPILNEKPKQIITFGAFENDLVLTKNVNISTHFFKNKDVRYIVYVGRGGFDMQIAVTKVFEAFKYGLSENPTVFEEFHFLFVGTSYAPKGQGENTIHPVAKKIGIESYVTEYTDRVPYFEGLKILLEADLLFIPGSDDTSYTASKLYPYILTKKPILGIFHNESSAFSILQETNAGNVFSLKEDARIVYNYLNMLLISIKEGKYINNTDWNSFEKYSAREMTRKQVEVFEAVVGKKDNML